MGGPLLDLGIVGIEQFNLPSREGAAQTFLRIEIFDIWRTTCPIGQLLLAIAFEQKQATRLQRAMDTIEDSSFFNNGAAGLPTIASRTTSRKVTLSDLSVMILRRSSASAG